ADVAEAIHELTVRGAHVSLDALGSGTTASNSLRSLRPRGRHVQVGLLAGADARPRLPMELVIARELRLYGSHGLAAADYGPLLDLAAAGAIDPRAMVQRVISLADAPAALAEMDQSGRTAGVTVVVPG
ncbi:MAG TPA: zinc-binding dehydrogenase, partial [Lacipirellulaceae bacterium]|nr:zinc-binding dehydrogenase [Lacipirellulaceae bacterium]